MFRHTFAVFAVTALLAGAAVLPATGGPRSTVGHTAIDMVNDGISVVFMAHSSRDLLAIRVRVVGPDDFIFEQHSGTHMIEWVPEGDLADGQYYWEALALTAEPGAPRTAHALAIPTVSSHVDTHDKTRFPVERQFVERTYATEHKQVKHQSGSFRVRAGMLQPNSTTTGTPGSDESLSRSKPPNALQRTMSAMGDFLISSAQAGQTIDDVVTINDAASDDLTLMSLTNNSNPTWFLYNWHGALRFRDALSSAGNTEFELTVLPGGNVGMGTVAPADPLHVLRDAPVIRFDDADDSQVWRLQADNGGYQVQDHTAATVPLLIEKSAPTSALHMNSFGNVGLGTENPLAAMHVKRSDSAQVLVEDHGSTSPLQMFKLVNNGFPAFNMQDTSQADVRWTFRLSGTQGSDERFTITKLGTGGAEMELMSNGDMNIAGTLSTGSSRSIKDGIAPVDAGTVLAKLDSLEISEWSYLGKEHQRHFGPMAEDFHATFGLGADNKHIAPGDLAGVALAAVKALKAENREKDRFISELEGRIRRLESLISENH